MASGDYDTHFSPDNMRKDSVSVAQLAINAGPATAGIEALYQQF